MTIANVSIKDLKFSVQAGFVAQHDRFWGKVNRGTWENDTFEAIDDHTDAQTLAIDCGAWTGPTSLYMARRAGLCLSFEPDPVAFGTLSKNRALNSDAAWFDRLKIFIEAVHSSGEPIQISGFGGNSMTSALNVNSESSWTVPTPRLQDILGEYRGGFGKVFVKIDVEGGEYDILPSIADVMADKCVSFLISFHHRRLKVALAHKHGTPALASEELTATMSGVINALPWDSGLRTLEGKVLERGLVEKSAAGGWDFAENILIE